MIVECVPNFSEGRDPVIVSALARLKPDELTPKQGLEILYQLINQL